MQVPFDEETEKALGVYLQRDRDVETPAEAVEKIVRLWLSDNGFLGLNQRGTRPEDLDASNDD